MLQTLLRWSALITDDRGGVIGLPRGVRVPVGPAGEGEKLSLLSLWTAHRARDGVGAAAGVVAATREAHTKPVTRGVSGGHTTPPPQEGND